MEGAKLARFSADDVQVHVDLEKSCPYHVAFLESACNCPSLTSKVVLERAIWRYEHCWLPLAAKVQNSSGVLPAPLDIEWVWHCHVLSPFAYEKDCVEVAGVVVDHKLFSRDERRKLLLTSKYLWEIDYPEEEFDYLGLDGLKFQDSDKKPVIDNSGSRLKYDIRAAMSRQRQFYYQISLPHFKDKKFLTAAVERYKRFLYLRQKNPSVFLVPSFDIDLMWQTHQVHPIQYRKDAQSLLGNSSNYDEASNGRRHEEQRARGEAIMRSLWTDSFDQDFTMYGAMHRGPATAGRLEEIPRDNLISMTTKTCKVTLNRIETVGVSSENARVKLDIAWKTVGYCKCRDPYTRSRVQTERLRLNSPTWTGENIETVFCDTMECIALQFSVGQKIGNFCFGWKEHMGDVIDKVILDLGACYPHGREFTRTLKIGPQEEYKLKYVLKCGPPELGPILLRVSVGTYERCPPKMAEEVWGSVPLCRLQPGADNTCEMASHSLISHLGKVEFTCRVLHSLPLVMSAVQVFYQDKMAAVAHLIGTDQLPLKSQVGDEPSECVSLTAGVGERAVLIKNNAGDWGILLGRWVGMRNAVSCIQDGGIQRAAPPSPGHLKLKLFKMSSQTWESVETRYESHQYEVAINNMILGLKSGSVLLKNSPPEKDIPENLALAFSIGILHVLCQPRPRNRRLMFRPIPSYDMAMIQAAGYMINTPNNNYLYTIDGARGALGYSGCVGMGRAWYDKSPGESGSPGDMDYIMAYTDGEDVGREEDPGGQSGGVEEAEDEEEYGDWSEDYRTRVAWWDGGGG